MKNIVRSGLLLFACFASPAPFAATLDRVGDELRISGILVSGDTQRFATLLPGTKRVTINSHGGDLLTALDIAEHIEREGLVLTVNEVCSDACAMPILIASPTLHIERGAVVAFSASEATVAHWGLAALRDFHARIPDPEIGEAVAKLAANSEEANIRLRRFLARRPQVRDALATIDKITTPPKGAFAVYLGVNETGLTLNTQLEAWGKCRYWVPSAEGLMELGLQQNLRFSTPSRSRIKERLGLNLDQVYTGSLHKASDCRALHSGLAVRPHIRACALFTRGDRTCCSTNKNGASVDAPL